MVDRRGISIPSSPVRKSSKAEGMPTLPEGDDIESDKVKSTSAKDGNADQSKDNMIPLLVISSERQRESLGPFGTVLNHCF